jgi:hypothetical protein
MPEGSIIGAIIAERILFSSVGAEARGTSVNCPVSTALLIISLSFKSIKATPWPSRLLPALLVIGPAFWFLKAHQQWYPLNCFNPILNKALISPSRPLALQIFSVGSI